MVKIMTALIIAGIVLLIVTLIMLWIFQFAFVRHNRRGIDDLDAKPNRFLKDYRTVIEPGMKFIDNQASEQVNTESFDGLRLAARYFECRDSMRTIILFHGYRSSGKRDFSCAVKFYWEAGLNVLLIDQRSHGKSEGRLITFGIKERRDVLTWVSWLLRRHGNKAEIFLGGMSMGASTVLLAAGLELPPNVKGIIADCGFTSPVDIIRKVARQAFHISGIIVIPVMNLLCRLFGHFSIYGISTVDALKKSKIPVLFIHGNSDNFVPAEMSKTGYEAAVGEKEIYLVDGADHGFSFLVDTAGVSGELTTFINKYSTDSRGDAS